MKTVVRLLIVLLVMPLVASADEQAELIIASIRTPRDTPVAYTELRMNPLLATPAQFRGHVEFASDGTLTKAVTEPLVERVSIGADAIVLERGNKKRRLKIRRDNPLFVFYSSLRAILAGDPAGVTAGYTVVTVAGGAEWQLELQAQNRGIAPLISEIVVRGSAHQIDFVRIVQAEDNWQEITFLHAGTADQSGAD